MQTVDLADWAFSFGSDPCIAGTALEKAPETFWFPTAIELLKCLALNDTQRGAFQQRIQQRLKADPIATTWHKQRTPFRNTTQFRCYRTSQAYQAYHEAAAAIDIDCATAAQRQMVQELNAEIAASRVVVPAGQMLFHGRADRNLDARAPYPSFVSTSLDPTVSIYHAIKRELQRADARATIYAFKLESPLPAMWGNGGKLNEWELLLQTQLTCVITKQHYQGRFDIIEAVIRP